ncbi:uncharacterized protein LODBEIA_P48270 [Lodderomyces beijingensis]|uniref:Checkpoint protein RAD24-like helical bundle domain-containing protein n=1 Tax=Lodderomyces beijingensis TaxID=1775926 RepID=A0ABP0ZR12_9ASCO
MPPRRKKCKLVETSFEGVDSSSDSDSKDCFSVPPSPQKQVQKWNRSWLDIYTPSTSSEICVNPTKLQQVREALARMSGQKKGPGPKLLVLSGPCGASKSTTVSVLANEMQSGDVFNDRIVEYRESERISVFLNSCRYKTNCVVLIEELPNIYHKETLLEFRDSIREWVYSDDASPPLVLCLSEFEYEGDDSRAVYSLENSMTADTLLGREILSCAQVEVIKFNPIAVRFLSKTVKGILKQEGLTQYLGDASFTLHLNEWFKTGDIRSVISNLEMWAKCRNQSSATFNRENSLNIFHALGKIIYSSKEFEGDSNAVDLNSIAQVIESYPDKNAALLSLGLLENYHIYQDSKFPLAVAESICEGLSINDICSWGEIGIRATRLSLSKVVDKKSSTSKLKMKFPRHFKMLRTRGKVRAQIEAYRRYIAPQCSFSTLNLRDGYFLPLIYNAARKKKTTPLRYNRLGGKLKEIYADEDVTSEESATVDAYDQFQNDIDIAVRNERGNKNKQEEEEEEEDAQEKDNLSDPIEESSQSDTEFSSDGDIDYLISQGKL